MVGQPPCGKLDRASQAFREVRDTSSGNTDEVLRERFLSHSGDGKLG